MVELIGDEHLKDDERWVRHLLEGTVGKTRVIDRRGGREEGKHDLEADLPDGGIAAIEITSEADAARLSVAAARRHLSNLKVPGSQFAWLVNVTPQADARALRKSAGLVALLADMEQHGQSSASALSDYRDPWRDQLKAFAIQSVYGLPGSARPGAVYVMNDSVASYGWVRPTADKWITDFLATKLARNKLAKADADEHHLAVLIHPDTDAGLGIAGAMADMLDGSGSGDLPSVEPPSPVTHLWLIAPTVPTRAFRWARSSGWALVRLPAEQPHPIRVVGISILLGALSCFGIYAGTHAILLVSGTVSAALTLCSLGLWWRHRKRQIRREPGIPSTWQVESQRVQHDLGHVVNRRAGQLKKWWARL